MARPKRRRKQKPKEKQTQPRHEETGGVGVMSSLRGGFKRVATGESRGPRSTASKIIDVAIWVLVIAAILFFAFGRMR